MTDELILVCRNCGEIAVPMLDWQQFSNGTVHLRAECPGCKRYIQYLPQRDDSGPTKWARAMGVAE